MVVQRAGEVGIEYSRDGYGGKGTKKRCQVSLINNMITAAHEMTED